MWCVVHHHGMMMMRAHHDDDDDDEASCAWRTAATAHKHSAWIPQSVAVAPSLYAVLPPLPAQQFCIRPPRRSFRTIHGVVVALRDFTAMPYGQVHCTLISGRNLKDQDLFGKMGMHVQDLHFGRFSLVCRPLLQHPKRGWCDRAGEMALQDAQQWRQNPKLEREKNVQCCRRGRQTDVAMLR